jgi:hypothetical protein
MVELSRNGWSLRKIAARFGVSKDTVKKWIVRANGKRLDRADFSDQRAQKKSTHNRIPPGVEQCIVQTRLELKNHSALGEFGAEAIHRAMAADGCGQIPSIRTINNVLKRNGLLDGNSRVRFPAPPPGWYIPEVCAQNAEMDCFDYIEDLRLVGDLGVRVRFERDFTSRKFGQFLGLPTHDRGIYGLVRAGTLETIRPAGLRPV